MEFWGVEVQSGKPLKVTPEQGRLVHISQASLGECKSKKGETASLTVTVGNQKLVLGTLMSETLPQLSCDLVFDTEFELSHNWGKGSVHFVGYKTPDVEQDEGEEFSDSEEEEEEVEVPVAVAANGNAAKAAKMDVDEDDSDDEEDSEEEEEETPKKKPESSKKRANEEAPKIVSAKKAKGEVTPKKTEEKKKAGHPATPHPAKKGGKTPTTATQSPKSASHVACTSCKKTFNSGNALESHNKAKHAAPAAK